MKNSNSKKMEEDTGENIVSSLTLSDGVDIDSRTIFMMSAKGDGEVDGFMANQVIQGLVKMSRISNDWINLYIIGSPGGSVVHGLAIYDAMKNCAAKIRMCAYGSADSIASVMLQGAHKRSISENTGMLMHDGEYEIVGQSNLKKITNQSNAEKIPVRAAIKIYLKRIRQKQPNFTEKMLEELMLEKTLTAKKAVELGLADDICKELF